VAQTATRSRIVKRFRRSRRQALIGALGFSIVVLATMLVYSWIFTSFDNSYVKGTLAAISAVVSAVGLATAIRAFGLRIDPVSAVVVLIAGFAVFFAVWLVAIDRSALECWSCARVDEHDFRQTNGQSAMWYFMIFSVSTACTAVTTSILVLLMGRALDQHHV
jgi:hypothetical protein